MNVYLTLFKGNIIFVVDAVFVVVVVVVVVLLAIIVIMTWNRTLWVAQ